MKPRLNLFSGWSSAGLTRICLGMATLAVSYQAAMADPIYWDGSLTGTNALWSTVTGWSTDAGAATPDPAAVPGANDTAIFSATTVAAAQTILLSGTQSAAGLSFTSGLAHTITGNTAARTLNLGTGGITVAEVSGSTSNVTLGGTNALNIVLSGSGQQEWNVGTGRGLVINNVVSGSNLVVKSGAGTLTLNGANTNTGGLTLNAGTLALNNAAALGSATGTFTIAGGILQNASTAAALVTNGAKPVTITGSFSYTVPNNGNGSLTLGSGPVTLAPTTGSIITVTNSAGYIAFNGPVSGDGIGLTKAGAGTLALLGNNTYTGQTELGQSANLRVNGPGGVATTNVYLNGGLLELGGTVVENNTLVLGTAPGQIRMRTGTTTAHAGFGSASGYRKISITSEGVPNAPLTWGTTPHFISDVAWTDGGGIFLLNTTVSSGTIELTNDLNFGGRDRRFSVRDGSAPNAPDAVLSGRLTNGSLSVQTSGTLFINNPNNTISGTTLVTNGGSLRVPAIAGYLGTSKIVLERGMLEVGNDAPVPLGDGPGLVSFGANGGGLSSYGGSRNVSFNGADTPLVWGSGGFMTTTTAELFIGGSAADGTTSLTNPIDLGSSLRNVNVQNGSSIIDASLTGVLSGAGGGINLISGTSGALRLANPANTYTGTTQISSGAIVVDVLADGGVNSNIGAASTAASNFVFNGGGLRYIGAGSTTNRLFEVKQSGTINASGFGPLIFSNTGVNAFTSNSTSAVTRTLSLSGIAPGVNELRSGITDSTVSTNNITALTKIGTGTWRLSGNNTHTGVTTIQAGELIMDYGGTNLPLSSTSNVVVDNSTVTLLGKSSGATAITIGGIRFGNGNNGASHVLKVDAPAGSTGVALTLGSLGGNTTVGNALNANLIDISSHAGNSVTVNAVNNGFALVDNVIFANAAGSPLTGGRGTVFLRDSTGYGFAAVSSTTLPSTLTKLTAANTTALEAANSSNSAHYHLKYEEMAGATGERTLTRTAPFLFSTLSIDATGGPVHLDLAANALGDANGSNGRGILVTGNNDVRITGTGTTAYSPFIYNYGGGRLSLNFPLPNGFSLIAGGNGLMDYSGNIVGPDARFYIDGGVFRFSGATDLAALTGGGIWTGNKGIIEIAADLNGAAAGDFSSAIGNAGGQVRLTGDTGFSAFGGNRTVNIGGNATPLSWGANYFLTTGGNGDIDLSFLLSSTRSDSTIEVVNPISLNGKDRVIEVANGSADTDAILSGEISGQGIGIFKRGAGTLTLSGTNTYTGVTSVESGTLRLTHAYLADSSSVRITTSNGAKLDLAHGQTDTIASLVINGTPVANGIYGAAQLPTALSGTGKLNVGGVTETGTPYDNWVTANNLPVGKNLPEQDADDDGIKNIIEYAVGSNPSLPTRSVLSKAAGTSGTIGFNRATGRTDITAILERSPDLATGSWTVIATSTAGNAYVSALPATVTVNESAATGGIVGVTVSDTTAPAPSKVFYRVRVTRP